MVDARLPDGSRVNAIIPPLALRGPTLTIRKFSRDPYTMDDLIGFGTVTPRGRARSSRPACAGSSNMLISGGTGTGKTTTLNALSAFIPDDERIVTIEDAAELQLQQEHVVTLESRPPNIEGQGEVRIRELVRNALRMRPDRIIVGEVRGAETLDMLQAMNTGHEGSLTTIHANTPARRARPSRDARADRRRRPAAARDPRADRAPRSTCSSRSRASSTARAAITHITEVLRMEGDVITLQDVFVATPAGRGRRRRGRSGSACSARSSAPASSRTSSTRWRPTASCCRRRSSRTRRRTGRAGGGFATANFGRGFRR